MLRATVRSGDQSVGLAIFGQQADAVAHGVGGRAQGDGPAVDEDAAGVGTVGAGQDARQLGAAGPEQSADTEDLARPQRESYIVEAARPAEALDAEERGRVISRFCDTVADREMTRPLPLARVVLADVAVGHQPHQPGDRGVGQPLGGDVAAVAQHRHALADAIDLVEPVRDVDDGDAAGGQTADEREQLIDLARR